MYYLCAPAGVLDTTSTAEITAAEQRIAELYKVINGDMQRLFATRLSDEPTARLIMLDISFKLVELLFYLSFVGSVHRVDMTANSVAFNALNGSKRKGKLDLFGVETIVDLSLNADKAAYHFKSSTRFNRDVELVISALASYSGDPVGRWQKFCADKAK